MRAIATAALMVSLALALSSVACAGSDGNVHIAREEVSASEQENTDKQWVAQQTHHALDASAPSDPGAPDSSIADAATLDSSVADTGSDADADAADADAGEDASSDASVDNLCFDVALGKLRAIVKPAEGDLLISEWMADPTAVNDAVGEWLELRATKDVDLNGLQVGNTTLGLPLIATHCIRVPADHFAVLARSTHANLNGLGGVPVAGALSIYLPNSNGAVTIGIDGRTLDAASWSGSVGGVSKMIDSAGKQCNAPSVVAGYNASDIGTPGAANVDCP